MTETALQPNSPRNDGAAAGTQPAPSSGAAIELRRILRLLTGLLWFFWAQQWPSYIGPSPASSALAVATGVGGLAIVASALLVTDGELERRLDRYIFLASVTEAVLLIMISASAHAYVTDELTYGQSAAAALLHGLNPYTVNLTPTLTQFGAWGGATVTLGGQVIKWVSYPSLSFLLYVPGVALFGSGGYCGVLTGALAWAITAALLWRAASPAVKPYVAMLVLLPVPLLWIADGATDPLYLPFLVVAVWRWDRFADPEARGSARWIGPVALGVACAVKQTPWLIAPYLLVGVALEAHRRGGRWFPVAVRYALLSAAPFVLVNLPFVLWNPGAWARSAFLPLASALTPLGIGPVELVGTFGLGGGNLALFALAADLALLATLVLFVWRYDRLRNVFPLLPLLAIFLSLRSMGGYFVFVFPIVVLVATTGTALSRPPLGPRVRRGLSVATAALVGASLAALTLGLATPSPLSISVQRATVGNHHLEADAVVRNSGTRALDIHFLLAENGTSKEELGIQSGPPVLGPGMTASYQLVSTVGVLVPSAGAPFQIEVATVQPETLAATAQITAIAAGTGAP